MGIVLQPKVQLAWPTFRMMVKPDTGSKSAYNYSKIQPAIAALTTERVCFVGIGDSNQFYAGGGNDDGWPQALMWAGHSPYATPLHGATEGGFGGTGSGSFTSNLNNSGYTSFGTTTLTSAYHNLRNLNHDGNANILQAVQITAAPGSSNNGITIDSANSLIPGRMNTFNVNANLEAVIWYGTLATGSGGKINPHLRRNGSPFTSYMSTAVELVTTTGVDSIVEYSQDIPAATIPADVGIQWNFLNRCSGSSTTTNPAIVHYGQVLNKSKTNGFCFNTLYGVGGQSAYDMCAWMQSRNDEALSLYFSILRGRMGVNKKVVVIIATGLNDRNETQPSVGPIGGITPGDSAAAYSDNIDGIIARIKGIYDLNGWDESELYWIVIPSHPVSNPNDSELEAYKVAVKSLSDVTANMAVVDINKLYTADDFIDHTWYDSANTDTNHCRQNGYGFVYRRLCNDLGFGGTVPAIVKTSVSEGAYLTRASNLSSISGDYTAGMLSLVLRPTRAVSDTDYIIRGLNASSQEVFGVYVDNFGRLFIDIYNGAGTRVVRVTGNSSIETVPNLTRTHYLLTWDVTGTAARQTVVNDAVTGGTGSSLTNTSVPALSTITQWSIGATISGTQPYDGGIGELWLALGNALPDLNVAANRRLFNDSLGQPIELPSDGILGGVTPDIYFRGADFATGTNRGAGGNFVSNGSSTVTLVG